MVKESNSVAVTAVHARSLLLCACILLGTASTAMKRKDTRDKWKPTRKIHGRTMIYIAGISTIEWFTVQHVDNELKRLGIEVYETYRLAGVESVYVPVKDRDLAVRVLRSDAAHADYQIYF